MTEKEKAYAGLLYDFASNPELQEAYAEAKNKCFEFNNIPPFRKQERDAFLKQFLGKTGDTLTIISPLHCDYGCNIEIGENFFANMNLIVLDAAKVKIGDNVFIAPNVGIYTAGHPFDAEQRAKGLEYAYPVTIGNNVWIGGHVAILPGVTIGDNTVIGAGSVVSKDIPAGVLAAGNPCRVIRPLPQYIRINDYTYSLPDERIAKFPLPQRDGSKLLVYRNGDIQVQTFASLPDQLPKGSLLIFNNTKVIQARLLFRKGSGALIEVFCLEPLEPNDYVLNFQQTSRAAWLCMVGNLKKWKEGVLKGKMTVKGMEITLTATRTESLGNNHRIDFTWDNSGVTFADILEAFGELPIPPYLNRKTRDSDKETYQTVYSKIKGSVAAPTAGLHFTEHVLHSLKERHIVCEELTLHVGAGTFKPVKSEEIAGHEMHTEYFSVSKETIQKLIDHQGEAIAVGTTSARTLESLYHIGLTIYLNPQAREEDLHVKQWQPYEKSPVNISPTEALQRILTYLDVHSLETLHSSTQIIIAPGYRFQLVKALITNFHQPKSTLLLLVSAFIGDDWKKVYDYALGHDFRFLSYGDSSLLFAK